MTERGTGVPGYALRAYRGAPDHEAMAAVRAGSAEHDGLDADSVVEGLPDAEQIGTASAALADPARDQVLVEHDGAVVGYAAVRRWRERDGTLLYLHRGHLLPGHRGHGVGSAMVAWAEEHIRRLVAEQGTAESAVFGANAMAGEREAARLLTDTGYRRVFSLVELELLGPSCSPDCAACANTAPLAPACTPGRPTPTARTTSTRASASGVATSTCATASRCRADAPAWYGDTGRVTLLRMCGRTGEGSWRYAAGKRRGPARPPTRWGSRSSTPRASSS
ncbi:hypothetical protein JCM13580A_07790 [Streptomyces drozdowiczii]